MEPKEKPINKLVEKLKKEDKQLTEVRLDIVLKELSKKQTLKQVVRNF